MSRSQIREIIGLLPYASARSWAADLALQQAVPRPFLRPLQEMPPAERDLNLQFVAGTKVWQSVQGIGFFSTPAN